MLYSARTQFEEGVMRFVLWMRCAYRNKYALTGLGLVWFFSPLLLALVHVEDLAQEQYSGLRILLILVCALFCAFGAFLVAITGGGATTVNAYDKALIIHQTDERMFRLLLAKGKAPCVEAGWAIAAKELGYRGDRE